jgi:hypothetical protein
MIMSVQYILNSNEEPIGVYIPISEWEEMKAQYKELDVWEELNSSKDNISDTIQKPDKKTEQNLANKFDEKPLQ